MKLEICVCTCALPLLDKSCAQVPVGLANVSARASLCLPFSELDHGLATS